MKQGASDFIKSLYQYDQYGVEQNSQKRKNTWRKGEAEACWRLEKKEGALNWMAAESSDFKEMELPKSWKWDSAIIPQNFTRSFLICPS